LSNQLLPGLSTDGIPDELKNTSYPFNYGDYEQFNEIVATVGDDLGIVIMEVQRYKDLNIDFLKHIRKVTSDLGIVLIFDEISSGFRVNIGGIHLLHNIIPDMAVFGKALGNGFPISAVLGKGDVMSAAQNTFISSSYWTERVGYVAALKTLDFYEKHNVIENISKTGNYLRSGLTKIFQKTGLNISVLGGLESVVAMDIKEKDPLLLKTIFIQEMLTRGFLTSSLIYVSFAHSQNIVDTYLANALEVFQLISDNMDALDSLLKSEISHSGFQRLN